MTPAVRQQTRALSELFARGPVLVLTGAGVSTDSGIPDYRDATGRMRHASPMTFQRFCGSLDERRRYWARSHLGWQRIALARPNPTHRAVAQLQRAGRLSGVVTQNVDGLHTAAGTRDVIDLHGRLDTVVCLDCGVRRPRLELGLRLDAVNPGFRRLLDEGVATHRPDGDVVIPDDVVSRFRVVDCRRCEGTLKPGVVFFGEHVPAERFRAALGLLDRSAALLVLGSSLMVGSGFRFVTAAARRGLPVAVVTRGVTRGDRQATLKIDAPLGEVLPDLVLAMGARDPEVAPAG
ncbi:NAD-dependent protein deacetylase [Egicoccus sp. AB-alg2]|uniref:NAD-dependent protein deacetylase n=1 Tax=Egicoccus sp. AB-alg2 TaxID=3242693 RepID=UPI00359E2B45